MQTIPSGFCPNEWNQAFGAFKRLVEHLDALQSILSECGDLTHADSDVDYIRQQLSSEVDTLQFMTSDAEKHWKPLSLAVASAAGRFSLSRPVDDVAWCSSLLNAAWTLHNGLRRELAGENAELCIQRLPLHVSRIPNDINQWRDRITAELRAGSMCSSTTDQAAAVALSKPLTTKAWAARFGKSETWVKDRVRKEWVPEGLAKKDSKRGSVRIALHLLAEMVIDPPE